ncbi:hypothetical protein Agub_g15911 [Astrephomene gubernaculifera]|uniref:Uncharacterized protein n=1 Tax=Astrephomene gubernaculifera TaxID=47775 RepID=A0AAD3E7H4_9CHLO|nr:hypothetical protein Agub_g15911 [Astrephomene gubernaculifera]
MGDKQCIRCLCLADAVNSAIPDPEGVVAMLVHHLPGLRELTLRCCTEMSYEPFAQQLMFRSIRASLPQLERLVLPSCFALEYVGMLGSNLRKLEVVEGDACAIHIDNKRATSVAELQALEELKFAHCALEDYMAIDREHHTPLRQLLCSLPPSLRRLQLEHCTVKSGTGGRHTANADVHLEAGNITSIVLNPNVTGTLSLRRLAEQGFFASLADSQVAPRLQQARLRIKHLDIDNDEPVAEADLQPVRSVLRCFAKVEVESICLVRRRTSLAAVRQALAMLCGAEPEVLYTLPVKQSADGIMFCRDGFKLQLLQRPHPEQAVGERQEQQAFPAAATSQPLALFPSRKDLLQHVLQRVVADSPSEAPATSFSNAGTGRSSVGVLLQGPLVAMLTQGRVLVKSWITTLLERTEGMHYTLRKGLMYWVLTPAAAVVLDAPNKVLARAIAEAASVLAEMAGAVGSLRATVVTVEVPPMFVSSFSGVVSGDVLPKVVQEAWDAAAPQPGEAGGNIGWRRLEWLLGLREGLLVLPEREALHPS